MKRVLWISGLLFCVPQLALAASLTTTDTMFVSAGGSSVTIHDNDVNDSNKANGKIVYTADIGNWSVTVISGTSNSPFINPALDISLDASCTVACTGANALTVEFTDINFTTPVGANGFNMTWSVNDTSGANATLTGWDSLNNQLFGGGTPPTVLGTMIGTLGPFSSGFFSLSGGGPTTSSPYGLTLEGFFSGVGTYSDDGSVQGGVPEPASMLLLGTGLMGLAGLRRKRLSKR